MKAQPTKDRWQIFRRRLRDGVAGPSSKALLRLDTRAIRKKALLAHRKAERALEKLHTELKQYHEHDVPGFRAWMHRSFGDLLTRQRDYEKAIAEKMALIDELKEIAERFGFSLPQAYLKVMWRHAHPAEAEAEDREQEQAQRQEQARTDHPSPAAGENETSDAASAGDDELEAWLEEMLASHKPRNETPPPDQQTAQELYRRIVRQLHPDHHGQLSEARAALWHEAQAAYRRHDLNVLHSILARCEDGAVALGDHTPVSLILRMTKQLAGAARSSRTEIRHAKRDVAWHFDDRVDDRRYMRAIQQELLDVLDQAQWMLDDLNRDLAELERAARRQAPQPRTSRGHRRQA